MISKNEIPNRQAGEEIIFHLRRHWFIFFRLFLAFVVLSLIPVGLYFLFNNILPDLILGDLGGPLLLVLVLIYYLMMLVFVFTAWTTTYLDVWTVTNYRVINREQVGLFNRFVSELKLYQIQDVTAEQKGFWATVFHYGDVYIQTAAERERFVFEQIPAPYRVAKIIQQLDERAKKENPNR